MDYVTLLIGLIHDTTHDKLMEFAIFLEFIMFPKSQNFLTNFPRVITNYLAQFRRAQLSGKTAEKFKWVVRNFSKDVKHTFATCL